MSSTLAPRPASILPDHIAFTDDGHAWWVGAPSTYLLDLVRPCDFCPTWFHGGNDGSSPLGKRCPDCGGSGRHVFTIEVDCLCASYVDGPYKSGPCGGTGFVRHRVSVVPGEVMPIYDTDNRGAHPLAIVSAPSGFFRLDRDSSDDDYRVELPAAAEPGMWAVKLRIVD